MTFAEYLEGIRTDRELTKKQFSELVGYSPGVIAALTTREAAADPRGGRTDLGSAVSGGQGECGVVLPLPRWILARESHRACG